MDSELTAGREKLKFERNFAEEITRKHYNLKREFEEFGKNNPDEQLKVCYLAEKQTQEGLSVKKQIGELEKNIVELRKHRQILRNEVKRLREETNAQSGVLSQRKEDVSRLKCIFSELRPTGAD